VCGLYEQCPQIFVTALGDLAQDRAISCFGTSPSQAPKSRPWVKPSPLPIAATTALEMIGPTPGTVITRWQASSCSASGHHEDRVPTHGYAETREAAMAAFAKSWRRE
jgi:hypothetical protein